MDILRILDELQELAVMKPRTIIGQFTYGLNKDEVNLQISKVRASLPKELKEAATTVRESDRIIETAKEDAQLTIDSTKKDSERILQEAKEEAARIIQQARLEQEQMLSENEILKISKAQSEEIHNRAEREALDTRRSADQYAYQVLDHLGKVVQKALSSIENGKHEVESPKEMVPAPKERVRV